MNWENCLRQSLVLVGVKEAKITIKNKNAFVSLPFGKMARRVEKVLELSEDPWNQDDAWKKFMAAGHEIVLEARPPTKLFPAKPGKLVLPYQKYALSEKDLPLAFVSSRLRYQKKTYYGYKSIWVWPDPMGNVWGLHEEKFCQGFVSIMNKDEALPHLLEYADDVFANCELTLNKAKSNMLGQVANMMDDSDTRFGQFSHRSSDLPQAFWDHLEDDKYEKHLRAAKTPADVLKAAGKRLGAQLASKTAPRGRRSSRRRPRRGRAGQAIPLS